MSNKDEKTFVESDDEFKQATNKLYNDCIDLYRNVPKNVSFACSQALMLAGFSIVKKDRRKEVVDKFIEAAQVVIEEFE